MSGTTPTNVAVYHLISELIDAPEQQQEDDGVDSKEEQKESSQEPTNNLEDTEQRSRGDAAKRLSDYRHRKRTTITHSQRAILEEFFANGMTSGGMQFTALHNAAAQKTGLSIHTIQVM